MNNVHKSQIMTRNASIDSFFDKRFSVEEFHDRHSNEIVTNERKLTRPISKKDLYEML